MSDSESTVIIIGGGLVGSLCALFLAKRGYQVSLYEKREDIRFAKYVKGRSINLALSHRGRKALNTVGLEEEILKTAIPMKGRLLHSLTGKTKSVPYDSASNQCIYSVERNFLNKTLIQTISLYSNVKLFFNHKLTFCNFAEGIVDLLNINTKTTLQVKGKLVIGADGAFSTLRRFMQQTPLFEFSQTYIEHGYLELCIPPKHGQIMTGNHLHIWPRGQFMMIALPNQDNSWTVTLFMPFTMFHSLTSPGKVLDFFRSTFQDAVSLIGEEKLVDDFFKTKPSSLVSIKCKPYEVAGQFLLIGDAAHAMVPFYGQGMNAGFEDCSIFNNLLEEFEEDIPKAVREFSIRRKADAHAICDLAMYNYEEMRDLVTRPSYRLRKMFDDFFFRLFPCLWIPLYNSVSFSSMGYTKCIENRKWQNKVISNVLMVSLTVAVFLMSYGFYAQYDA